MSLVQLANLAEFISAIAVLVTLVYLAIEFRQNTFVKRIDGLIENLPEISPAQALADWQQLTQKLQQQ